VVNGRVIWIELRRSWAPLATLVLVGIALLMLYSTGDRGPWMHPEKAWNTQWVPSVLWVRFLLILTFPIAFGAGMVQGRRDHRSGMQDLLGTVPRSGRTRGLPPAVAMTLAVAAGYALVQAVGIVQVVSAGGYFTFAWVPVVLVGLLAVAAGALLGLAAGRLLPHPALAPIGTVAVFALVFWTMAEQQSGGDPLPYRLALLGPALPGATSGFQTMAAGVDLGQAVWFTGLAATGFLLLVADRRRARALAVVPAVAAVAVALAVLPAAASDGLVHYSGADQVCSGPVCATRLHEAKLALLAQPGRRALTKLARLDDPPTQVRESAAATYFEEESPRTAGVVQVDFIQSRYRDKEGDDLERALVAGAGLPACPFPDTPGGTATIRARAARTVSAAWFMGDLQPVYRDTDDSAEVAALSGPAWQSFRALTTDEQLRRINALRHAELTCPGGDPLDLLTKGAAR
jgi:hypothetical protein